MAERRPSNRKAFPLWLLEPVLEWLRTMSAESLWLVFHDFVRILVVLTLLLWCAELFHRYGTDPTKTIRTGWVRWLADRLEWAVDYKATVWAIVIALALACGIALVKEAIPPDDPTTRSETKKPTNAFPSPEEATPHQKEEPRTSSLSPQSLMRMVEAGLGDDARSQLGRRITVQGQVYSIRLLSDTAGPSSTLALLNIEIALEFDHEDYPEKVVNLQVYAKDKEELDKIRVITEDSPIIASGVIEQIERGFMVLTDGRILAMNRRRVG